MNKLTSGVLLALSLLGIFACAAAHSHFPGQPFFFAAALFLMAPMCYLAEQFDGGIPTFYEEIHH